MKHVFALSFLLILSGCVTEKRCYEKYPPVVNSSDSSSNQVSEHVQDSSYITRLPGDSSWIKLYIECNEYGQALIRQIESYKAGKKVSVPEVTITGNVLTAKCKVDSLEVYNRIKKTFKTEIKSSDRKVKETKYINVLTRNQRWQIAGFWIESALLIIIFSLYLKRKLLP